MMSLMKPRRPILNVKITYFLAPTGAYVGAFLCSFVWFKLFQSFQSSSFWLRSSSSLQEVFKLSPSALSQHSLRFLSISPLIHFIILRALFIQPLMLKILCLVCKVERWQVCIYYMCMWINVSYIPCLSIVYKQNVNASIVRVFNTMFKYL